MNDIFANFPITESEFSELDKKFGKLGYYAAHQLRKKNSRNNFTDDIDDISQELQLSVIRAGSYYKRQVYIERSLLVALQFAKDHFLQTILNELCELWDNRTRHGANRQKFGRYQEILLQRIVNKIVPKHVRPDKAAELEIDTKFARYCKQIIWNAQRSLGKKITREKPIRSCMVSLGDYNYLAKEL
jgi:hypothetical protein